MCPSIPILVDEYLCQSIGERTIFYTSDLSRVMRNEMWHENIAVRNQRKKIETIETQTKETTRTIQITTLTLMREYSLYTRFTHLFA